MHEQQCRVDLAAAEGADIALLFLVPGLALDGFPDVVGARLPQPGAILEPETVGDAREAVAGRPAHQDRKRMDPLGPAKLPDPRVLRVEEPRRRLADPFEDAEQALVPPQVEPLVEERLRAGEDHGAVDIVLGLDVGLVAGPHRPVIAIAPERIDLALGELGLHLDAEHRLQRAVQARGDDVEDVVEILLHRPGDAEAVQRADDEIGVAQPAEPVIPVARGPVGLGDRGGDGGHHRAGLLHLAQFQGDGRADHRVLPLKGQRDVAHPFPPVILGPLEELAGELGDVPLDRVVGAEDQVERAVEQERRFLQHEGDRRVGGETHDMVGQHVAQVIAAARHLRAHRAVIARRAQPDADLRGAGDRDQAAHQGQRAGKAAVPLEARREVLDLQRIAGPAAQHGLDDRGVRQIALLARFEIVDLDLVEADRLDRAQQVAEHRVAVEARHARPDHAGPRIEQAGIGAVADDGEIERLHP